MDTVSFFGKEKECNKLYDIYTKYTDVKRYKDFLLHMIPGAKLVSGGNEIQCRCRECPDSRDPRNIGHFYISIPKDEYSPSLYWCHKCNCRGLVTYEKLIEWNIFDEAVAIDLVNHRSINRVIYKLTIFILCMHMKRIDKLSSSRIC